MLLVVMVGVRRSSWTSPVRGILVRSRASALDLWFGLHAAASWVISWGFPGAPYLLGLDALAAP